MRDTCEHHVTEKIHRQLQQAAPAIPLTGVAYKKNVFLIDIVF